MEKSDFKGVYVFIEQREGTVQNVALELLGKARELADKLGEEVVGILPGYKSTDQAQKCVEYGADRVLVIDAPELEAYTTEPYAQAINQVISERKPAIVLFGATTIGRDLGPRLSARVGTGLTADCTGLEISDDRDLMMTRPAFGGNLMATIVCREHRPQMSTVRPGVMRMAQPDKNRKGEIEQVKIDFNPAKFRVRVKEHVKASKNLVDIADAKILVSGGRGVGSKEGFDTLHKLADAIGAEVSLSLIHI